MVSKQLASELRDRGLVARDYETASGNHYLECVRHDGAVLFTGTPEAIKAWLDGEDSPPLTQTAFERIEREERARSRTRRSA